jgi:uncharacterized protein (TIGR02391 family)
VNILLNEPAMRARFNGYCDFLGLIVRYEVYCTMARGETREDYLSRVEHVEREHYQLIEGLSFIEVAIVRGAIDRLKRVIAASSVSVRDVAAGCEEIFREFLFVRENEYRAGYLAACAKRVASEIYSKHLMFAVMGDLESGKYDAAIQAAFKVLDAHLQRILALPPSEHGESLINKAFAPDGGGLKLGGDQNEQRGLRNFASGANAVFRNAVAHRPLFNPDLTTLAERMADAIMTDDWSKSLCTSFYDEITAQTVVALVALLIKAATKLAMENDLIKEADAPNFPFGPPLKPATPQ